ncbi:MAG: hydantoinase/oxoprolinase family protein [Acetobacteraceae bacterium]
MTDANLVLGYLDPAHFLGGSATLDVDAAEAALDRLAARLKVDRVAAAEGVHRVVNTNMAEGIRLVSVRRGVDPRQFALLSFGGAAGLHVTDVARQLDLVRVVVPRVAAVLSAWGMLATDLRFEVSRTHIGDTTRLDGAGIKRLFAEMEQEGLARLRASFDGPVRVQRSVEMRYGEQIFEITVPLDGIDWEVDDPLPAIVARFHDRHEELYTYALREQGAVLVNARAAVIGVLPGVPQEPVRAGRPATAPRGERRVWLRGWTAVPVHEFDDLAPGQAVAGPAIVESAMTTVLLRPADRASVTPHGWLDIAVG